jgi:hypothetical protein
VTITTRTIAVLAELPLPNRCKPKLLAGYTPDWIAGLCAAMLRDTLDGLLSIDGVKEHVVVPPADLTEDEANAFGRHIHAPWVIASSLPEHASLVARADAPSADIAPLTNALASATAPRVVVGANDRGVVWVALSIGLSKPFQPAAWELEAIRAQCKESEIAIEELESKTTVVIDETDDVLALLEELRRHPERAPRTAQFLVTRG